MEVNAIAGGANTGFTGKREMSEKVRFFLITVNMRTPVMF